MNINFEAIEKAWFKPKKNVLDELEEYLKNELADGRSKTHLWLMGCYDEAKMILDKIQELKKEVK